MTQKWRGIQEQDFHVIRVTNMPADSIREWFYG